MCRSCYSMRCELKQLYQRISGTNARYGDELAYRVTIAKAESAQVLGQMYEDHLKSVSTLDCEHAFAELSKKFVKKDLFNHAAILFENFSLVHRRYLMYLIGKIMQEYYSRTRRRVAYGNVALKSMEEVLADRGWGTYRVEDDVGSSQGKKRRK
jgi:hypothetical protein